MRVRNAILVVLASTVLGFLVGASPIGRGIFEAFGGTAYDGWEVILTAPAGAVLGMVLGLGMALLMHKSPGRR